jgi:hypothetical protein
MSTSSHFWANVRRQSLFLIQPAGGRQAPKDVLVLLQPRAGNHRQIVQIAAFDDEPVAARPDG